MGIILISLIFILYLRYFILFLLIPRQLNLAIKFLHHNDESQAVKFLSRILKLDRGNPQANWLMSQIYMEKKQFILAQMYLYDILYNGKFTDQINEVKVRETLAILYQSIGDYNKALVQYYLLKKKNKLTISSLKNSIRIVIEDKNYKQANVLLKFAYTTDKTDGELDYFSALIDFDSSRFPSAERKLKESMEKGYKNYKIDLLLGKIYFLSRKYNLALKHFQNISAEYLNADELDSFIGQCFYHLKDYETTIKVLESFLKKISRKNNFTANLDYMLGCAYEAIGNIDKALDIWNEIDSYAPVFQPVKEKISFYRNIAKDEKVRDLFSLDPLLFTERVESLITAMDFDIKKKIFEDDRSLDYLCVSSRSISLFNLFYIHVTRKTQPISIEFLNSLFIKAKQKKTRSVVVIAPYYRDDAMAFAKRSGITAYTFNAF